MSFIQNLYCGNYWTVLRLHQITCLNLNSAANNWRLQISGHTAFSYRTNWLIRPTVGLCIRQLIIHSFRHYQHVDNVNLISIISNALAIIIPSSHTLPAYTISQCHLNENFFNIYLLIIFSNYNQANCAFFETNALVSDSFSLTHTHTHIHKNRLHSSHVTN